MAFKTIIALIYQIKFNLLDKPLMWCRMRSRRKEYQKHSDEIKQFYEKELCVKEVKKEENPEIQGQNAAPSLMESQESEEERIF